MNKETKNLMDKLKDFEDKLLKIKSKKSDDVNFYLNMGMSANTEMFALETAGKIIDIFYDNFQGIKKYKK